MTPSPSPVRILLLHRKSDDDAELEELRGGVQESAETMKPPGGKTPVIVLGREDHSLNFARAGSWDAWARDWALGTRYAAYVVVNARVGKATGGGLELALRSGKPIFFVGLSTSGELEWKRVTSIREVSRNWKEAYVIEWEG